MGSVEESCSRSNNCTIRFPVQRIRPEGNPTSTEPNWWTLPDHEVRSTNVEGLQAPHALYQEAQAKDPIPPTSKDRSYIAYTHIPHIRIYRSGAGTGMNYICQDVASLRKRLRNLASNQCKIRQRMYAMHQRHTVSLERFCHLALPFKRLDRAQGASSVRSPHHGCPLARLQHRCG